MPITFENLIDRCIVRLGQVSGIGTQLITEPQIAALIQDTFDLVWPEAWWLEYRVRMERTLDAAAGLTTVDINDTTTTPYISDFNDVHSVWLDDDDDPIPQVNTWHNIPVSGTKIMCYEAVNPAGTNAGKLLQFYPITATGTVDIFGRQKPTDFVSGDTIYLDTLLLQYGVLHSYMEDEATSPGKTQELQIKFDTRLKQLQNMHGAKPTRWSGNKYSSGILTDWVQIR